MKERASQRTVLMCACLCLHTWLCSDGRHTHTQTSGSLPTYFIRIKEKCIFSLLILLLFGFSSAPHCSCVETSEAEHNVEMFKHREKRRKNECKKKTKTTFVRSIVGVIMLRVPTIDGIACAHVKWVARRLSSSKFFIYFLIPPMRQWRERVRSDTDVCVESKMYRIAHTFIFLQLSCFIRSLLSRWIRSVVATCGTKKWKTKPWLRISNAVNIWFKRRLTKICRNSKLQPFNSIDLIIFLSLINSIWWRLFVRSSVRCFVTYSLTNRFTQWTLDVCHLNAP